ncbi:MAG TPA: DUF1385 domain-containing protein, partial [Rubrobacteraceae bacterium]|nr:DUF1385 domain-containing protein [Rubrobacteraceae bacterium]
MTVDPETQRRNIYAGIGLAFALFLAVYFVYQVRAVMLVLLLTLLFSVIISRPVDYLARKGLGRGLGTLIVLGTLFTFFAAFPILPLLVAFFAALKFTSIGRYHGAEHKAVAAYEQFDEVTLETARRASRIHPRCGTNILSYIIVAALLDPLIPYWWYAIAQFILISEAWFVFGKTRRSIAMGDF